MFAQFQNFQPNPSGLPFFGNSFNKETKKKEPHPEVADGRQPNFLHGPAKKNSPEPITSFTPTNSNKFEFISNPPTKIIKPSPPSPSLRCSGMPAAEEERVPDALSLFASCLSQHRYTTSAPTGHHLAPQSNPPSLCFRTAGLGMTNSRRWRPHFPPAPTSPRCSPRARLPGVSCELVRRRRFSSPTVE
jgi:hypothetical protein